MASGIVDPTFDLVTLFGRLLPEQSPPEAPRAAVFEQTGAKKRCSRCREMKPASEFGPEPRKKDGLRTWCRACCAEKTRKARMRLLASDPGAKRRISLYFRQKNYGLSPERFEEMMSEQGGCCAICRNPLVEEGKGTHVDHCHKSGRVRALLCFSCNHAVGWIERSGCLAADIDTYLARHKTPH